MRNRYSLFVFIAVAIVILLEQNKVTEATAAQITLEQTPAIILFIGDGMGAAQRTAGRWASVGQQGQLHMDTLPVSGWSVTSNISGTITDSAAAATAMATGEKTQNGRISVDAVGNALPTILEQARAQGWAVGLVSTVQIAHATPGAFAAHEISRYNYSQIAAQILAQRVNVLLAGGEDDWLPETKSGCYPDSGHRTDDRDLIAEAVLDGYTYVCSPADLAAVDLEQTDSLLGLFADDGMLRPYTPTLLQMTETAITILSQDPEGFFLMVEGGQIDWAAHVNDGQNVISDVLDFDAAVAAGLAYAQSNANTLIIVTADHETGGMEVELESSGQVGEEGPFWMPDGTPFFISWATIDHSGIDVPVTSSGPKSELLLGTSQNTFIYETMRRFLGWRVNLPGIHK